MLTNSEIKKGYEYLIYIYNDSVSFSTLYHFMHYFISCRVPQHAGAWKGVGRKVGKFSDNV